MVVTSMVCDLKFDKDARANIKFDKDVRAKPMLTVIQSF